VSAANEAGGRSGLQLAGAPSDVVPTAAVVALLAAAALVPFVGSRFLLQLATGGLVLGITAMSFSLLAGFGGMLSLAQMAFYGMASYAIAIMTRRYGWPPLAQIPVALAAAMSLSALFGLIAVRATGVYFLMMTLALSQLFFGVALQWQTFTGGYNGISGIARPTVAGFSLQDAVPLYYVALLGVGCCYLALRRLLGSPFGLTLRAIRDNPVRMAALGFRVQTHRWLMIVISGGFAGIAGILGTYFHGVVSPDVAGMTVSIVVVLAALLGGVSSLFGALVGAMIVTILLSVVSFTMQQWFGTDRYWTVIGAALAIVVVFLPDGLFGGGDERPRPWRSRRSSTGKRDEAR
jgi:branched-chain amino acid transport system permease protein